MTDVSQFDPGFAFDVAFNAEGGRVSFDGLEAYQKDLLSYVDSIPQVLYRAAQDELAEAVEQHDYFNRYQPQAITFGLVNTCQINCYAVRWLDRHYVGMGALVPLCILELATYFFHRHNFMPELGDAAAGPKIALDGIEAVPFFQIAQGRFVPRLSEALSDNQAELLYRSVAMVRGAMRRFNHKTGERLPATEYVSQVSSLYDFLLPQCPVRRYHTQYVVNVLSTFLWVHEITHVTHGHLEVVADRAGFAQGRLNEFPDAISMDASIAPANHDEVPMELLLSMEFDADIEALLVTCGLILEGKDDEGQSKLDPYDKVKLFVFFLLVTFDAIAVEERRIGLSESGSHPPARFRLLNLIRYLNEFASRDERLNEAFRRAMQLVHEHHVLRTATGISESDIRRWFDIDDLKYSPRIREPGDANLNLRFLLWQFCGTMVEGQPIDSSSPSLGSSSSTS